MPQNRTLQTTLIALLTMGQVLLATAQNEASNWFLMYNKLLLNISQNSFSIDTLQDTESAFIAHATIGNPNGELQFFSCGFDVRDKRGILMDNGCCLCESIDFPANCMEGANGNPHKQGALILPKPGSSSNYFLFIKDMDIYPNGQPTRVQFSEVDMSLNNGLGKVIRKLVPILDDTLSDSRMTAVRHGNGRDWWLINHEYLTNRIYLHLITPDSIYGPFSQNIGYIGPEPDAFGWSLFSKDGTMFATVSGEADGITLLDFDRCSGIFSNPRGIPFNIDSSVVYYNLAFSPSGRFLYAGNVRELRQYDLWDTAFSHSTMVIDTAPYPLLGSLVLMPDNKIYMAGYTTLGECLSVINNPDSLCPACSFGLRTVCIPGSVLILTVPNFANYNLSASDNSVCDTLNLAVTELLQSTKIYPNPASNTLTIQTTATGPLMLSIYAIDGRLIKQLNNLQQPNTGIDISDLQSGIYFIAVSAKGQQAVKRFIKQ